MMDTAREYIEKTRSAAQSLITGIDRYLDVLRGSPNPVLVESYASDAARDSWLRDNRLPINAAMTAQRIFVSEAFAMANLSGALLQIAAGGIRMYSLNQFVPQSVSTLNLGESLRAYCVGRLVRGVPLGLIVYAGRNQYNHFDDDALREPNSAIFERLATGHGIASEEPFRDPAYDLSNPRRPLCLANNVTALIEWRNYARYEADMKTMLNCDQ
jgi:hypothetical protein